MMTNRRRYTVGGQAKAISHPPGEYDRKVETPYTVNSVEKKFSDGKVCYCGKCLEIELQPGSYTFVQK